MEWWFVCVIQVTLLSPGFCILRCQHYLNRRREGVFHYDRHMRYQLTYDNAQEACMQDFGATIATRGQLVQALKSGFEECRAGWIASAEVAYPRINRHWNCGENKTGIISYGIRQSLQEKWDVFCYKEDDDCSRYERAYFEVYWVTLEDPARNISPTSVPAKHEFTSEILSASSLNTSPTIHVKSQKGDIRNDSLPIEINPTDTWEERDSNDPDTNNFENHSPSITFPEYNESMERQENMSVNTTLKLNSIEDKYNDDQNRKSGSDIIDTTYVPISEDNTRTGSHLSTITHDTSTDLSSSTITTLTVLESASRLHNIRNPGEGGANSKTYGMNVMKDMVNGLPMTPVSGKPEHTSFYHQIYESLSTFISEASKTASMTEVNSPIHTTSESGAYSANRLQTKFDVYNTDLAVSSTFQGEGTTQENVLQSFTLLQHLSRAESETEIAQITPESKIVHEQEHIIPATPVSVSFPSGSTANFPHTSTQRIDEIVGKDNQYLSNYPRQVSHKPENEMNKRSDSSSTVRPQISTEVQTGVLHSTTDSKNLPKTVTSQYNEFFSIQPPTSPILHFEKRGIQASVVPENDVLMETIPTSTMANQITIKSDENGDIMMVTTGSQESFNEPLTPNEEIRLHTQVSSTRLPARFSVMQQQTSSQKAYTHQAETVITSDITKSSAASEHTASTVSSLFTPSVPMKQTGNQTSQSNVTSKLLDACGGLLKGLSGQFYSPGFPQSYEKDMNCTWDIEAPLGYYVTLDFLSLVIEEHRYCQYDYVLVYDGKENDQRVLGRFCGSQLPSQIQAASNVMTVIMRSDSSVELDGISVQFRTIQSTSGIRLTEGKNPLEGVVEIEYQGIRGNICAKQWNDKEAQVVCRQLGFSGPAVATRIIGEDSVSWAISFVSCSGTEFILKNCSVKNSGMCGTRERAGVVCQVYESCAALKNAGVQESGTYTIDPDGVGQGERHFPVECDMVSDITTGITIVGHDSENKERVSPCKEPGCYSRVISYKTTSLAQLRALTTVSENCEQFVKLDCRHIHFLDGPWGWWVSRDGDQIISWGGASTNSGRCACGENGECAFGITSCNCDANDDIWRMDEGAITDKSSLPIQEVRFGITEDGPMAMAFHRIGKFRCWGTISDPPVLESCAALKEAGITDSGRYVIDPDGVDKGVSQFEVFCDMSSQSGITVIGHNSERRMPVSPCEEAGCYKRELTYSADLLQLNALTKVSQSCEQFVRLDCRHLRFIQSGWGWWVSWDGKRMDYWGGADPAIGGCACGKTGTCSSPAKLCNCDSNDNIWRTDDGFLRDKTALPIQAVYFGDTNDFPLEMAYHTIGKLRCRGRAK